MATTTEATYAPPPGPPPSNRPGPPTAYADPRPPLIPTSNPLDLNKLATQGWLSLPLEQYPAIRDTYAALFSLSEKYFDLPDDDPRKTSYAAPSGAQASEEGYSRIPEEKQILTCRSEPRSPKDLRDGVRDAWAASGDLMRTTMEDIARSLGLPPDTYQSFVEPCTTFHEEKTPTLLRMFRYDRPPAGQPRVVAEPHRDLGVLSMVIGHTPGLDVFEPPSHEHPQGRWISIEDPEGTTPTVTGRHLTATLMGGQVLNFLSQGRYTPGVHRVSVRPAKDTPYRFSLVFAFRPAQAPVYTALLESPQTGPFPSDMKMNGESMGKLFEQIVRSHWNINVQKDIRENQRRRFEEDSKKNGSGRQDAEGNVANSSTKRKRFSRVLRLIGMK
jgi:isopenicillin N synthase-like dioxygenase